MRAEHKRAIEILRTYGQLKNNVDKLSLISSPRFDKIGSGGTNRDKERVVINYIEANERLDAFQNAINEVETEKYRFILINYIMKKEYKRDEMCTKLNCSRSKFNYLKNNALNSFIDNYKMQPA